MEGNEMTPDQFDFTECVCHKFKFEWTIKNCNNLPGHEINTTVLSAEKCSLELKVILRVTSGSTRKLKLGLFKTQNIPRDLNVLFSFEFSDFRGVTFGKDSLEFLFQEDPQTFFSCEITKPALQQARSNITNLQQMRHQHYISVKGHIVVRNCCQIVQNHPVSTDESVAQLQQDFRECLQCGLATDITLNAGNEHFAVHKFVLCARSSVFKKMFLNEMIENRQNIVEIEDINGTTLKHFLTFLYTGEIEKLSFDEICKLYSAGDKYEVLTLLKSCRNIIISSLSNINVSGVLELADTHNDSELEEAASEFICKNFKIVSQNDNWNELIHTCPLLVSRTLQKVSGFLSASS